MPCGEARKKRIGAVPGTSDSAVGKARQTTTIWSLHPSGNVDESLGNKCETKISQLLRRHYKGKDGGLN